MSVEWNFPTRIVYGVGAVSEVGEALLRDGQRTVLIVADTGVIDAGVVTDVEKSLRKAKIAFETFAEVASNPSEAQVRAAAAAFQAAGAQAVVAVGGGSVIDVAKLARMLAAAPTSLDAGFDADGKTPLSLPVLPPLIAVPTTAGAGSEVGMSATFTAAATGRKARLTGAALLPDLAVLDPQMTLSLPPATTAATGFDALTHAIEAYCASGLHPMADVLALRAMELVVAHLEPVVREGNDIESRGQLLVAACMAAVAAQKGLGACHALAYPLASCTDLHHGLANALCLPAVIDFNRSAAPEQVADVAQRLGVRGDDVETLAFECSGAVRALRRKCGLPDGLESVGVADEQLPPLAALAFAEPSHVHNPRACTIEDLLALYRASL
ncbi:MAG: iron-containing alcohol dehydrogenase [Polyangiales bacterium]